MDAIGMLKAHGHKNAIFRKYYVRIINIYASCCTLSISSRHNSANLRVITCISPFIHLCILGCEIQVVSLEISIRLLSELDELLNMSFGSFSSHY